MKIRHIVVSGKNQVELQELELEEHINEDEILIETEASFISPGTELAIFGAKMDRVYQPGTWCEYPWKAGYANVGVIQSTGNAVTKFKPGQRVFTHGGHGSMIVKKESDLIVLVPDAIDSSIAAASRLTGISATSIHVADIPQNGWVAVYGLGMIGNMAAQIFQIMGCKVIGIDPNATRRKLAAKCGVHYTAGGTEEEIIKEISRITNGSMCQISVDAVGHSSVVLQAMKSTAKFGQVILLGTPRAPYEGNMTELLWDVHSRWISLRGALNFSDREKLQEIQEKTFDWIQTNRLKLEPLISHTLRPEQIEEAYDGLLNKQEEYTGVVLKWK